MNKQRILVVTEGEKIDFFADVQKELLHAEKKFVWWPTDVMHMVTIVTEEVGEAAEAALKMHYDKEPVKNLEKELIQVAVTAMRAWVSLRRKNG